MNARILIATIVLAALLMGCTAATEKPTGKAQLYESAPGEGGGSTGRPPTAPQNLVATAMSGGQFIYALLTWERSQGSQPIDYYVYRSRLPDFNQYIRVGITDSNAFNDYNVLAGNAYYYRVKARNNYGFSGWSNIAGVVFEGQEPSPPRDLNGSHIEDGNLLLYNSLWWEEPLEGTPPFTYNVYRDVNGFNTPYNIGSTPDTNYTDSNILSGVTYYYAVTAENDFGESGYSNEIHLP